MGEPEVVKKYVLALGENTYSSPASGNKNDARRLQSLIPSLSGALEREQPKQLLGNQGPLPSRIAFFHTYKRNNLGSITYFFFLATANTLYQWNGTNWTAVTAVGTLSDFPVAINIINQMRLSDGTMSWLFDGTNWVREGLQIPGHPPIFSVIGVLGGSAVTSVSRTNGVVTVVLASIPGFAGNAAVTGNYLVFSGVSDTSFNTTLQIASVNFGTKTYTFNQPGFSDSVSSGGTATTQSFTVLSNRYYWITYSDQSATHPHESSSSPISLGTGPFTNSAVVLKVRRGTISTSGISTHVTGVGTDFNQSDVGLSLYAGSGFSPGIVASVTDAQNLTLVAPATIGPPGAVSFFFAPARATHINFYCSASEEDKIGQFLGSLSIASGLNYIIDQSPMIGTAGSYIGQTVRPLLNDPPNPSKIMEVHKSRIWRRLETFQNFFSYTGNEEILAENAGTPSECVPGQDPNTVSPGQVNETSYPDQSVQITGIRKHGDALFVGTQENVIPLYGGSLADFQLSEVQAFAVGFAGRRLSCSTPFGLAFVSYDLKVYLYPSQYSFGVDSTTALVELGRPKRPTFEQIDGTDFQNAHLIFYNWGRRNWLVLSYRDINGVFQSWVFDFEVKGWFQLQTGYTAIHVLEFTPGRKSLIAAGTDNQVYVIDDLTGNFPTSANLPAGTYRELVDFGQPDTVFAVREVGFETSNSAMEVDVTIYLDPVDPENPGQGIPLITTQTKMGANSFTCRPNAGTGSTCQRVLVEFIVAANNVNGTFHGFTIIGEATPDPVL